MSPEQEILMDLAKQIRAVRASMPATMAMIGTLPHSVDTFEAMPVTASIGTTAMLEQFEQPEDALPSGFRSVLKAFGQRLEGLYALDIGNRMVDPTSLTTPMPGSRS